jgi:eukaryotic-like serine/threonine-protein kinase
MIKQIGRYSIEAELGRGAFGRVYRAYDPNLKIHVAIKVLMAWDDPAMLGRFHDEAQTNAGLLHKNIVTVHEFAEHEGAPYLVMELLEGRTLQQVITTHESLGLLEKVEIMYQVAEGLQHAHAKDVIHRDIKPGNVMVLPQGTAKILDFGIARLMKAEVTRRTRRGDIAGTLSYMAPEQLQPEPGDADRLTDIWAYGVIYYELLTGTQPFYANDLVTVIYRVNTYEPPPLRESLPDVPEALEHLVHRLLTKDRELRIDKMEDVVLDTQPILQQLRHARASVIAEEIRPLIEAGQFDAAKSRIDEILKLDPLHGEARRWRDSRQAESQRQARRAKIEALIEQGRKHLSERRHQEAAACFENAQKLDKSRADVALLLEEAKATLDKARRAARLVAESRAEIHSGHLDEALERALQAAALDPGNRDAAVLGADLGRQIQERRTQEIITRAEAFRVRGDYPAARAALEELGPGHAAAQAARVLARIDADEAEIERRKKAEFLAAFERVETALSEGRLRQAEEQAEALHRQFPGEPAVEDLLAEVRERWAAQQRAEAIQAITASARAMVKEKRLEEAGAMLAEGMRTYPGNTSLERLAEMVATLIAAQQRMEAMQEVLNQANALRERKEWEEARLRVEAGLAQFGSEPALEECRRKIDAEQEQHEYTLGRDRVLVEAMMLLENQPQAAVSFLENAFLRYSGEPEIVRQLALARQTVVLREQESVRRALGQIEELERSGEYRQGLSAAEVALASHAGDPSLRAAAERLREKLREQERSHRLSVLIQEIETAIESGDWTRATLGLNAARSEFPDDARLADFPSTIREGRRRSELQILEAQVRDHFARAEWRKAAEQLAATRREQSREAAWHGLWRELESAVLAAKDRLAENIAGLEDLSSGITAEPELERILSAARAAVADQREQALRQMLERIAAQESVAGLEDALRLAESELARFPGEPRLQQTVERLRSKLHQEQRTRSLAEQIERIEQAIELADWDRASANLNAARQEFGDDAALGRFSGLIQSGQRGAHLSAMEKRVRDRLAQGDLAGTEQTLEAARKEFSSDPEWQDLWRELQRRKSYEEGLEQARKADTRGEFGHARELLTPLLGTAPDQRARELLTEVTDHERIEAQKRAKEQAIAEGCRTAAEHARRGDLESAVAVYGNLARQFPDHAKIRQEHQNAMCELEQKKLKAAEEARARLMVEVDKLCDQGKFAEALARLDKAGLKDPELSAARQRVKSRKDLAEQEKVKAAEEHSARLMVEVDKLCDQGKFAEALARLDKAGLKDPEMRAAREKVTSRRDLAEQEKVKAAEEHRERLMVEVDKLCDQGKFAVALAKLDQAGLKDPELRAAREKVTSRRDLAESQRVRSSIQSALELGNQDPGQALSRLESLRREFPNRPELESAIEDWRQTIRRAGEPAEDRAELDSASVSGVPIRRPQRLGRSGWVAAGVVALVIAGAGIWFLSHSSPKPSPEIVSRTERRPEVAIQRQTTPEPIVAPNQANRPAPVDRPEPPQITPRTPNPKSEPRPFQPPPPDKLPPVVRATQPVQVEPPPAVPSVTPAGISVPNPQPAPQVSPPVPQPTPQPAPQPIPPAPIVPPQPPPPQSAPQATVAADENQAIQRAILGFAMAYSQKNLKGILELWPRIPKKSRDLIQDAFREDRESISYVLQPEGAPVVHGDQAQIRARRIVETTYAGKRPQVVNANVVVFLEKNGGQWTISDMR